MIDENIREKMSWKEPINITSEQWMSILRDEDITKEKDFQILKLIYSSEGFMATASHLAQLLHMPHFVPLNSEVGRWGKRIVKRLGIQAIRKKSGEGFDWWNVPFLGIGTREGYYWILRPELQEAMNKLNAMGEIIFLDEISLAEEIDVRNYEDLYEGARKQIYVNSYERNRRARDQCVQKFGARCMICGFDFEKMYGAVGKDVIHVHHLEPLSSIGENYIVDPIEDLRPVCPNCHVIIHKRNPPYSLDEVSVMIKRMGVLKFSK